MDDTQPTPDIRPFEGMRVIHMTHVLAGPFATYQLGVFGADVIKIEIPDDPDQTRMDGVDAALNEAKLGTHFIIQNAGKRSLTLDLKTPEGRGRAAAAGDDRRRAGREFPARGDEGAGPGLQRDERAEPAADLRLHVGLRAGRSAGESDRLRPGDPGGVGSDDDQRHRGHGAGTPAVDYATGTMGAFALAAALLQRERTGRGQYIDLSMLDTALVLLGAALTNHSRSGREPGAKGNHHEFATVGLYPTAEGQLQLAAINIRQQRRLWQLVGHPDLVKEDNAARRADAEREREVLAPILLQKTAAEWEDHLQKNHIPAARVWTLPETLAHPQMRTRDILHRFEDAAGIPGAITVPKAAFKLAHGGARIDRPPPGMGEHNEELLRELGFSDHEIDALRRARAI